MFSLVLTIAASSLGSADTVPVELGKVPWLRDYDAALAEAKKSGKPLLLLFQEVPG